MTDYVHRVSADEATRIRHFLYGVAIGSVLFVLLVIALVAAAPMWVQLISHESERRFVAPHVQWIEAHLLERSKPVLQSYVGDLGAELAAGMDAPPELQLRFIVVDSTTVNAFTTLGGYVFVMEGLLQEMEDENSLAMVLAHEIAHAVNRDPLTSASRGLLLQVMVSSLRGNGGIDPSLSADRGLDLMLNAYSREQEAAADRLALEAINHYYGHVGGATQAFEALRATHGDEEMPEILSSHPDIAGRIATLTALAREQGWDAGTTFPYPRDVRAALSSTP